MTLAEVNTLQTQVLWAVFGLALAFGVIAQRSHFCTMGAVADIVNMGDWTRMRMWVLAMAVAIVGFNGMVGLGWVSAADSIYAAPRLTVLSALVGGAMFGFGMVLASGCGSKTLLRVGAGNLKSLVVLVVMAVSAFATLRGVTAVLRVNTVDAVALNLPVGQDLPSLLAHATGLPVATLAAVLGCVVGGLLLAWVLSRAEGRSVEVWVGGLGIGSVIVAVWWVSGQWGHVAEHPATLEPSFLGTASRRMESFSFVAPSAHLLDWLIYYSDGSKRMNLGLVATLGVVLGSAAHAVFTRSFRWEGFRNARDTGTHLAGAVLMGVGGVTAIGCTVGQGLSGVSTLGLGSVLALLSIIGGAVAGVHWQAWQLEREVA
jgi:uncharacterized membrane protein YedE/YeeE